MINHFAFVLRADAGEHFALRLRDAEFVVDLPDFLRHFGPVVRFFGAVPRVINDVVEIQFAEIRAPGGQRLFVKDLERLQPMF